MSETVLEAVYASQTAHPGTTRLLWCHRCFTARKQTEDHSHSVMGGGTPGIGISVCVTPVPELLVTHLGGLRVFEGCFKHQGQVFVPLLSFLVTVKAWCPRARSSSECKQSPCPGEPGAVRAVCAPVAPVLWELGGISHPTSHPRA